MGKYRCLKAGNRGPRPCGQDPGADLTGFVVEIIVVGPHHPEDEPSSSRSQGQGGRPGFWTGVAASGVGSYLYNRATQAYPVSNLNQRLMTGRDPGRPGRWDGLVNFNHNRRLGISLGIDLEIQR